MTALEWSRLETRLQGRGFIGVRVRGRGHGVLEFACLGALGAESFGVWGLSGFRFVFLFFFGGGGGDFKGMVY